MKDNSHMRGKAIVINDGRPTQVSRQAQNRELIEETKRRQAARSRIEDLGRLRQMADPLFDGMRQ